MNSLIAWTFGDCSRVRCTVTLLRDHFVSGTTHEIIRAIFCSNLTDGDDSVSKVGSAVMFDSLTITQETADHAE
jgi:hypothetical protein